MAEGVSVSADDAERTLASEMDSMVDTPDFNDGLSFCPAARCVQSSNCSCQLCRKEALWYSVLKKTWGGAMTERGGYGQFCPISMAAEVLCTRWTVLLLREFLCGSTRFNDLRRGVPKMSPTLLSKRLKELERAGVVRVMTSDKGVDEYHLTASGEDLRTLVMAIGTWGQRWVESRLSLRNLDPSLLMWDMRRNLDPRPFPEQRCTVHFQYPEIAGAFQNWWLVVEKATVDMCSFDPGYEIDLLVSGSLRSMTSVWMGVSNLAQEISAGKLSVEGDPRLVKAMPLWLGLSPFAKDVRRVA